MKLKVCHLTSVHSRYDTRIFRKICISLAHSEYDVYLVVADGKGDEIKNNIKIVDIGLEQGRLKRILFMSKRILKKAIELDCELYHFHDPELFPIALKLRKLGKKIIFDSHEYLPGQILDKEYLPKILRKFISFLVSKYYDINIKKIDAVFSVSPHIVEKLGVNSDNAFLLTNYPIVEEKPAEISLDEYILRGNKLCYAGTVYRSSLQENIIEAIYGQNEIKYVIVGTFNNHYKADISDILSSSNVQVVDKVSRATLMKIYQEATIGIAIFDYSPNLGYKIGSLGVSKIFEYMYSALPIICTDFELWKEIVDKYKCGIYVNPHNINEIRNAINYLIENKQEAYQMGQNGRRAVLEEYNWNAQEKIYIDIIKQVISKSDDSIIG